MLTKFAVTLGVAVVAVTFASSALALNRTPLNPQPLPPRCVSGVQCPRASGGADVHAGAHAQPVLPSIKCTFPKVPRQERNGSGKLVWKCIHLRVD
jgi:hypothetical protein